MTFAATAADLSTFIAGNISANKIVRDADGNLYLGIGEMTETGLARSIAVLKLDPSGTRIVYRRQIGGAGYEYLTDLAVTPDGRAFVLGNTTDKSFATTPDVFQPQAGALESAAFLVALNADGSVRYSTLISSTYPAGGRALAVNAAGEAYVTGLSGDGRFPENVSLDLSSEPQNHFVLKLDASGSRQVFAVKGVSGQYISLDRDGNVYLAGTVQRPEYPTTPGAYRRDFQFSLCGATRAFGIPCSHVAVSKLNPTGTALRYSTFIAGSRSEGPGGLAVDDDGYAYVGVNTTSPDYPVTPGAYNWERGACVTKLNRDGSGLEWSACLGPLVIRTVAVGRNGGVLAAGYALDDPTLRTRCQFDPRAGKGYVSSLSPDGTALAGLRVLPDPSLFVLAGEAAVDGNMIVAGYSTRPEQYGNHLTAGFVQDASRGATVTSLAPDLPVAARRVACVRDGADYAYLDTTAPGQLLTLFGSGLGPVDGVPGRPDEGGRLPSDLAGIRVTFDEEPAPLLYASERQINVAVPFGVAGRHIAHMRVFVSADLADERDVAVVPRDPRVFRNPADSFLGSSFSCLLNVSGPIIQGAVNPDGTLNSCNQPAPRGSVVAIFLHGLGQTGVELAGGTINPVPPPALPLAAEISNPNLSVEFLGAAARQITGVSQINVKLPSAGGSYETFLLRIGGVEVGPGPLVIWIR